MKYALSVLCLSFFIATYSSVANARTITSFRQSDSISAVTAFMYDAGEDIPYSTRITDKKINLKDFSKCPIVSSENVLEDVALAIRKVIRFYPDEEVPFEQALLDIEDYLDHQPYRKCALFKKKDQSLVRSTYYVNSNDSIHLRLDNITLIAE